MYVLEQKMDATQKRSEEIAINLIRRGKPLEEIHEDIGLPIQRIEELIKKEVNANYA